jgi:hypothetical protein
MATGTTTTTTSGARHGFRPCRAGYSHRHDITVARRPNRPAITTESAGRGGPLGRCRSGRRRAHRADHRGVAGPGRQGRSRAGGTFGGRRRHRQHDREDQPAAGHQDVENRRQARPEGRRAVCAGQSRRQEWLVQHCEAHGMYLSPDSPTRSVRYAPTRDGDRPIVGGAGHPVGREKSPACSVQELDSWARKNYPGAMQTHYWSAQDYTPADELPYVADPARQRQDLRRNGFRQVGHDQRRRCGASVVEPDPGWADGLGERIRELEPARAVGNS